MQRSLDIRGPDLVQVRAALHKRLRDLRAELDRIVEAVTETERRINLLEEIWTWDMPFAVATGGQLNGHEDDTRLLGMPLAAALVSLRRGDPAMTKKSARERLDALGYRYSSEGPNIGRAIHAAWIAADRRLGNET